MARALAVGIAASAAALLVVAVVPASAGLVASALASGIAAGLMAGFTGGEVNGGKVSGGEVGGGGAPDPQWLAEREEAARVKARLEEMQSTTASLRHDLRGILSPALLTADRLLSSEDPVARKAAAATIRAVERANARLSATSLEGGVPDRQRVDPGA